MSASSQQSSPSNLDPMDLLDFSEYDAAAFGQSPSVTPPTANKSQFARPSTTITTPATLPSNQPMTGPSHQYDQYKQQTPFVPGALTTAMNMNQTGMTGYNLDYVTPHDDMFDFNSTPSQTAGGEMEMNFESPAELFYGDATINPNTIGGRESQLPSPTVPSQTSNMGRMYPGMHQQAALAKQRQQQQQQAQQQQQRQSQQGKPRSKSALPADPIVEQKITQLLSSMRTRASGAEDDGNSPLTQVPRTKKEEDDMDEDERLLASEEGKKLSSKERRQLRNKVSARAFRSRRKEYIGQLEAEISTKVQENNDLRIQNRALGEENRRLSDLTRMLLSSPSFSNFLDHLSQNPAAPNVQQAQPQPQQAQQPVIKVEQRQAENAQLPKDINPYVATQQQQQQQIGMAMIPEQPMDFSMLNLDSADGFNYQPQVFTVLETPEVPVIDTAALSGKSTSSTCDVADLTPSDKTKAQVPVIESPVSPSVEQPESATEPAEKVKVAVDLDSDIYDDDVTASPAPTELNMDSLSSMNLFGGVESEKTLARYELVDSSEGEMSANIALMKVERLAAGLESSLNLLNRLTAQL